LRKISSVVLSYAVLIVALNLCLFCRA